MGDIVYSEDQRDCLQEICNVAMGQAGDALARKLDVFVTLSIPVIRIVDASQLSHSLVHFNSSSAVYAASQLFVSSQDHGELNGLGLVMLSDESVAELQQILGVDSSKDVVIETCRNMAQTCLDALSEQWELGFQCDEPELLEQASLQGVCDSVANSWQQILSVEINYQLEGYKFNGDLVLLFADKAILAMANRLDNLLA
jgi:chemotaxis protein CheY-P-specific phosphatase CheC